MNFSLDTRCDSKKDRTKRLLDENKASCLYLSTSACRPSGRELSVMPECE